MDIHQTRIEIIQDKIIAKMEASQERTETNMNTWREWNKGALKGQRPV
jgi:hypothetical protein